MKLRTEDDVRAQSRRQAARAFIAEHGPLPEQPLESRTCAHAGSSHACSCHLTLAQIAVAEELGHYTLYIFGMPYTGRVKVPFYPGASAGDSTHVAIRERHEATQAVGEAVIHTRQVAPDGPSVAPTKPASLPPSRREATRGPGNGPVAPLASLPKQAPVAPAAPTAASGASRPKRAFDPIYNAAYAKARRRGAEAVAAFKAEWAAKKAAA